MMQKGISMSSNLLHRPGTRSWWSGTVTTLCGITVESGDAKSPWFPGLMKRCPQCEAAYANKRK